MNHLASLVWTFNVSIMIVFDALLLLFVVTFRQYAQQNNLPPGAERGVGSGRLCQPCARDPLLITRTRPRRRAAVTIPSSSSSSLALAAPSSGSSSSRHVCR